MNQNPTPADSIGDEDVELGVRSAREVFLPLFEKELAALTPEERTKAWCGFMSAAVAGMASETGLQMASDVCMGVIEGLASMDAKPTTLMEQLLDRHGKLKLQ